MNPNQRNILSWYRKALSLDLFDEVYWYSNRNQEAEQLAVKLGMRMSVVVGVIAVISPNVRWETNLRDAEVLMETYWEKGELEATFCKISTYGTNKTKALQILGGGEISNYVKGPKVSSFYENILYPYSSGSVTVDRHAWRIWKGLETEFSDMPDLRYHNRYQQISEDYREVASQVDLLPHQLQAITWVAFREMNGNING